MLLNGTRHKKPSVNAIQRIGIVQAVQAHTIGSQPGLALGLMLRWNLLKVRRITWKEGKEKFEIRMALASLVI